MNTDNFTLTVALKSSLTLPFAAKKHTLVNNLIATKKKWEKDNWNKKVKMQLFKFDIYIPPTQICLFPVQRTTQLYVHYHSVVVTWPLRSTFEALNIPPSESTLFWLHRISSYLWKDMSHLSSRLWRKIKLVVKKKITFIAKMRV